MDPLVERTRDYIAKHRLINKGENVLVAVSGGLDSVVLLHVLHTLAQTQGWRLVVAHLNHKLRGQSSAADERLVRATSKQLGLNVFCDSADIKRIARAASSSIEMAARAARHDYLARVAHLRRIKTIALAHHADDQVELFFIRLLRGSGTDGLAGMAASSASPANRKLRLVRPFLGETKTSLRTYAVENKIAHREDATNASIDFLRNRIRHELLPLLSKNYQPALGKVISRVIELARADAAFAADAARDWLSGSAGKHASGKSTKMPFEELSLSVQRRVVQQQLIAASITPEFDLVEHLRVTPGKPATISGSSQEDFRTVSRSAAGLLSVSQRSAPIQFNPRLKKVELRAVRGSVNFAHHCFHWQIGPVQSCRPSKQIQTEIFDADRIGASVALRHWRPGDRFWPIGMNSEVKLQDLLVNAKIPFSRRRELVVATTEAGEIFWVEGLRISESFKIRNSTKRQLRWRWNNLR